MQKLAPGAAATPVGQQQPAQAGVCMGNDCWSGSMLFIAGAEDAPFSARHFIALLKTIVLPRQAWDRHRKT